MIAFLAISALIAGGIVCIVVTDRQLRLKKWVSTKDDGKASLGRTGGLASLAIALVTACHAYGTAIGIVLALVLTMIAATAAVFIANMRTVRFETGLSLIVVGAILMMF